MPSRDYRDLIVWKRAFELALAIYEETSPFPNEERFGLKSQIRKAFQYHRISRKERAEDPKRNFGIFCFSLLDH